MDQPTADPTITPQVTPPSRSVLLPVLISSVFFMLVGIILGKYLFTSSPSIPSLPSNPSPTSALLPTPVSNLTTYTDSTLGFEFQYPNYYLDVTSEALSVDMPPHLRLLAKYKHPDNTSTFSVLYNSNPFSLDYLKTYAPTGSENLAPVPRAFGTNTFYYYGAGGGGVNYPDQFFISLSGKILIFKFDGPYLSGKSPSENTILLESQILPTFKFTSQVSPTDSSSTSSTKTWSGLGVSFNYPSTWHANTPISTIKTPESGGFYQQGFGGPSGSGLTFTLDLSPSDYTGPNSETIILGGRTAYKYESYGENNSSVYSITVRAEYDSATSVFIAVRAQPATPQAVAQAKEVIDQVITSLQFTN